MRYAKTKRGINPAHRRSNLHAAVRLYYRRKKRTGCPAARPAVITTVTASGLETHLQQSKVAVFEVLPGFTYIGTLAEEWEHSRKQDFLFG